MACFCTTTVHTVTSRTVGGAVTSVTARKNRDLRVREALSGGIATGAFASLQGDQVGCQAACLVYHAGSGAGSRFLCPIAPVNDCGWLVALAGGEALVFAAAGPPQDGAEQ